MTQTPLPDLPSGPMSPSSPSNPALSEWALAIFALIMLGGILTIEFLHQP